MTGTEKLPLRLIPTAPMALIENPDDELSLSALVTRLCNTGSEVNGTVLDYVSVDG